MPYGEECRGCWVFTASSKQPTFVVDAQVQNIINPTDVYSGMWGNININFFAYNSSGKKGIGCGLNGVQKTRDGEALSARVTAEEAFCAAPQVAPSYGAVPAYQQPTPSYPQPVYQAAYNPGAYPAPAAPAYPQPMAPTGYGQPAIDPITGQPYAPGGISVAGL